MFITKTMDVEKWQASINIVVKTTSKSLSFSSLLLSLLLCPLSYMFCEKSLPGIRLCVNGFWSYARLPSPLTGTITTSASCTRPRASASPTSSTSTSWSWSTTPSSTWAPEVRTAPRLSVSVLCVRLPRAQATPNPTIRWLDYIELHARRGRRQYTVYYQHPHNLSLFWLTFSQFN